MNEIMRTAPLFTEKKIPVLCLAVLFLFFLPDSGRGAQKNMMTLVNNSGEEALVKIVGPKSGVVELTKETERTILLPAGTYKYYVRYSQGPKASYARGTPFTLEAVSTGYIEASLTLISPPGNYQPDPVLEEEFNKVSSIPLPLLDFLTHQVKAGESLATISQWYSGDASRWQEIARYNPGSQAFRLKGGEILKIPNTLMVIHNEPPTASEVPQKPVKKAAPKKVPLPPANPEITPSFGPK
jgi:LysM repeat protein